MLERSNIESSSHSAGQDASSAFINDYFSSTISRAAASVESGALKAVEAPAAPASISAAGWAQVGQWLASDTPVHFTAPQQGVVPDYILGADGQLTQNPAKTTPSADGSITVQVESKAGQEAAKKAAQELEVAAVQQKIFYWQQANPGRTDIPHFLKSALAAAQSSAGPEQAPAPVEKPQAPAPVAPELPAAPVSPVPRSEPPNFSAPGSHSIGNRSIGPSPSGGYRPGNFEPNGPIDRSVIPPPIAGDLDIKGPPSANVEQIQNFLERIGSPAAKEQGFSQALYDACTERGIDPAVAVGFFLQESTCGRYGRANGNHSLGNIKGVAPESGGSDGTFRAYNTWAEGARDWARLIDESYVQKRGLQTLSQVISVYAPSSDGNNERGYVATVKGVVENFKQQNKGTAIA